MFTKQIYAHVMREDSFFKLTVKITELCHKILKFSVLCSLISDLCIDLPIAKIGRTGLCVLQMGGGGGHTKEVSMITVLLVKLGSSAIFWSRWNLSTNYPIGGKVLFPKDEFLKERPEGSRWFECSQGICQIL